MSDINWDEAPEGAEYSYENEWYKIVNTGLFIYKPKRGYSFTSGEYHWADCGYHHSLTDKMTLKPVTLSPVYTEAMSNHGIKPLVGMECIVSSDYDFNGPINANDFVMVYATDNLPNENTVLIGKSDASGVYACSCHIKYLKPITPPIELIDGEPYMFCFGSFKAVAFYDEGIKSFNNQLATYYAKHCTNIQLLTVEVK